MLLLASCYFYMVFRPVYILILAFTILVDYAAGILIASAQGQRRKIYLAMSIAANVGVLAIFKYFNFLNGNFAALSHTLGIPYGIPNLDMILPIGLSFHTFQSLSYTIEVYYGRQQPERNLGILAVYVMFYPQLVAGPIERPQNLLHQFHEPHTFDYAEATNGLKLMCWGFFKKVVIADQLAPFVNVVYNNPTAYPGISLLVATLLFAFQIYCDFSGYSDIAIGSAKTMGFRLMRNFDSPYYSMSVSEFWRRWHIALSTWFRDYVYVPLGGSRTTPLRRYANLLITFMISGLWHGANWTYVIWGGLNGLYLVGEQVARQKFSISSKLPPALLLPYRCFRAVTTFMLICFAWIFFRAKNTHDAFYIVGHLGDGLTRLPTDLRNMAFVKINLLMGMEKNDFLIASAAVVMLPTDSVV